MKSAFKRNRLPVPIWGSPARLLACGFGSGAAPYAPGTVGTVAAIPLYLLLAPLPLQAYLLATALLFAVGVWACHVTARSFGVHDHGGIVWDEFIGYLLTMTAAPSGWQWPLLGFVLFRLFDILKPWPIRWLDRRIPGGLGIMLDDLAAGVYALIGMQVLAYFAAP